MSMSFFELAVQVRCPGTATATRRRVHVVEAGRAAESLSSIMYPLVYRLVSLLRMVAMRVDRTNSYRYTAHPPASLSSAIALTSISSIFIPCSLHLTSLLRLLQVVPGTRDIRKRYHIQAICPTAQMPVMLAACLLTALCASASAGIPTQ